MLPFLHRTHGFGDVACYWAIVFAANIVGTLLFAAAVTVPHLFKPEAVHAFNELGSKAVAPGFTVVLMKGLVAGLAPLRNIDHRREQEGEHHEDRDAPEDKPFHALPGRVDRSKIGHIHDPTNPSSTAGFRQNCASSNVGEEENRRVTAVNR